MCSFMCSVWTIAGIIIISICAAVNLMVLVQGYKESIRNKEIVDKIIAEYKKEG